MCTIQRKSAVLLFLSEYKSSNEEFQYLAPDGNKYSGIQSSDAPMKYIINADKNIQGVFCIVTKESKGEALDHLMSEVLVPCGLENRTTVIEYEGPETFSRDVVSQLLAFLNPKDTIWIDTTGGFRDISMHMALLYETMEKMEINKGGIVYSNFKDKKINEISLENQFDLIKGINDFKSDGDSKVLQAYFKANDGIGDREVENIFKLIDELTENMSLCKVSQIEKNIEEINEAIEKADNESNGNNQLYLKLKNLIAVKFKLLDKVGELSIMDIINWCNKNNQIQEALTIYVEGFPGYIIKDKKILEYTGSAETEDYDKILNGCFFDSSIAFNRNCNPKLHFLEDVTKYVNSRPAFRSNVREDKLKNIFDDYFILKNIRNQVCHANIVSVNKELADYYRNKGVVIDIESMSSNDIKNRIESAVQRLQSTANNMK